MNLLSKAKANPTTSFVSILAVISNAWNMLAENADLLSIPSKWIAIGTVVLAIGMMAYNQITNPSAK